ncbi:hypothetical protein UY3_07528 [Chelonia mydas]|uniref:Uncharacterized protein n=1 Tax=Chelonia mydas TaxID=8469 RepID=M7BBP9_CHEMY|nr:hypothetical protein UY3_07528 [Chelonia mydas]
MTPASQPQDDAMEGWALVQGKRRKWKARAPLLPSDVEAPWKTRKGGTNAEPSALPTGVFHPPVPAGEDVAALEGSISPAKESLPSKTPEGASSALVPSEASMSPEVTVASGASGENPGVADSDLPSIYEEIEALGLTPVTQGEDDPMPAGLDLGDLTPAPLFP